MYERKRLQVLRERSDVVFSFADGPAHVLTFAVTASEGTIVWKLLPAKAESTSAANALFWSAPAPTATVNLQDEKTDVSDAIVPALERIVYGKVPDGYVATQDHGELAAGATYHAVFIAEEGHGGTDFTA